MDDSILFFLSLFSFLVSCFTFFRSFPCFLTPVLRPQEPQLFKNKTGRLTAVQLTRETPSLICVFYSITPYIYENHLYTFSQLYHWLK